MTSRPEIDGIEILEVLGRGGSSVVYKAHQHEFDRFVAVKVLEGIDLTHDQQLAFSQELRVMGILDDEPHVVPVYRSGTTKQGRAFLVMQLMSGGSLASRVKAHGPIDTDELLNVGIRIGGALEAAHVRGIRHCDVKPANVLLDSRDTPMLADFGVSVIADSTLEITKRLGMTAMYAAPEVIEDEIPTAVSDVYSLGATLFALANGSPPFSAQSDSALIHKILSATEPPTLPAGVPQPIRDLIASMMQRDPRDRPQDMKAVVTELTRLRNLTSPIDAATEVPTKTSVMAAIDVADDEHTVGPCLLYTSPSPRDATLSRMPSSA